jgi:hypothetical protein
VNAPHASGTFYIAPAGDPRNEYAAGYDGNVFATRAEAEKATVRIRECGEDFARCEWTVEVRS